MSPLLLFLFALTLPSVFGTPSPIQKSEFVFEHAPFESCHASTIVQTKSGFLVAWFGGSREGASDVKIWASGLEKGLWSRPVVLAEGPKATWNPVLFKTSSGRMILFFKVGESPQNWKGMRITSIDEGLTWSKPSELPDHMLGPSKNKPLELSDGKLLYPSSKEEKDSWRVHVESSDGQLEGWQKSSPINRKHLFVIQPTLIVFTEKKLLLLMRSSRVQKIMESWSFDVGKSWTPPKPTTLPNPNSALDAVVLRDGRALVVYNNLTQGRGSLDLALSTDEGKTWSHRLNLETAPGEEFSYPAVIQADDGLLRVTYTWKRKRIKMVVIDPKLL